jgi:anti-sigma factor RsiW
MTRLQHLQGDELQTFVEGGVQEGDRAMIESHLVACLRCRSEVEEWRSLFTALCRDGDARGNLVADAYHAALATEAGAELITTARDNPRFPGLRWPPPFA